MVSLIRCRSTLKPQGAASSKNGLLDRVPRSRQFSHERQIEYPIDATQEMVRSDKRLQVDAHRRLRVECMHSLHDRLRQQK